MWFGRGSKGDGRGIDNFGYPTLSPHVDRSGVALEECERGRESGVRGT